MLKIDIVNKVEIIIEASLIAIEDFYYESDKINK